MIFIAITPDPPKRGPGKSLRSPKENARRIRLNQARLARKWGLQNRQVISRHNITKATAHGLRAAGLEGPEYKGVRDNVHRLMQRVNNETATAGSHPGDMGPVIAFNPKPLLASMSLIATAKGDLSAAQVFIDAMSTRIEQFNIADQRMKVEGRVPDRRAHRRVGPRQEVLTVRAKRLVAKGTREVNVKKLKDALRESSERVLDSLRMEYPNDIIGAGAAANLKSHKEMFNLATERALDASGFDPKKRGELRIRRMILRLASDQAKYASAVKTGGIGLDNVPSFEEALKGHQRMLQIVKSAKGPAAVERFNKAYSGHSNTIIRIHKELQDEGRR